MPPTRPTQTIFFDDDRSALGPMTDLKSVLHVRTGVLTQSERLMRVLKTPSVGIRVPDRLVALTENTTKTEAGARESALWVNAAWSGYPTDPPFTDWSSLEQDHALIAADGTLVAAHLSSSAADSFVASGFADVPENVVTTPLKRVDLIRKPWDILNGLSERIVFDAGLLSGEGDVLAPTSSSVAEGGYVLGDHPVMALGPVTIDPGTVLDTRGGPIVLGADVKIGACAVIEGPCAVLDHSVVQPHTQLRPNTVIGPVCKVAGEVSGSVFQGYSNKAHLGFVGDSLVGSWCNLGANTNVSNLKNTYGSVRVQLEEDRPALDSGRIFQGPVLGDFVRTAIGTHLLTGSVIGTGSMLAVSGYSPKFVDCFRFVTDQGDAPYEMDLFFKTAQAMMARREQTLAPALREACLALTGLN